MDDKQLSEKDFSYERGSLIVRLRDSFLNTLTEGEHTLKVSFADGDAITTFYVTKGQVRSHYVIPLTGVE